MAKFEIVESGSDEHFDVVVEGDFENMLSPLDNMRLLQLVSEMITSRSADNLFEGFGSVEVGTDTLKTRFRYARKRGSPAEFQSGVTEVARRRMHFLYHLFARVDSLYPLAEAPFPAAFREYLELPEYLP